MCIVIINAPGNFHDFTISDYGMYELLKSIYEQFSAKIVVDGPFKITDADFLIFSSQEDPQEPGLLILNCEATSIRQLSEWGMRIIQSSYPRLKEQLRYEETGERFIILRLMINLFNFQTHMMGQNQIMNSFMNSDSFFGYNINADFNAYL